MDAYMIVFRILHIASAALWFGAAVFYTAFIGPTLGAIGPAGPRFFGALVRQAKAVIFFVVVSTTTVIAGGFLYWRVSGGLDTDWMQTGFGAGLTIGALAGLFSWSLVLLVLAPTSYRLAALGEVMTASGEQPSKEQLAAAETLRTRLSFFAILTSASLAIATLAMASARYLAF